MALSNVEEIVQLGSIEEDFKFCGHTFGLKTLKINEEVASGPAIAEFRDTATEGLAWQTIQVGLSLTHIDGDDSFCPPIGPDSVAFAKARFRFLSEQYYIPTIEFLYGCLGQLKSKQLEKIRELQDLSEGSLTTSMLTSDSLKERGISITKATLDEMDSLLQTGSASDTSTQDSEENEPKKT